MLLPSENDTTLVQSRIDYDVFGDDLVASNTAARFLEDIMHSGWDDNSGENLVNAHGLYVRYSDEWGQTTRTEQWEDYCAEVKEHPRQDASTNAAKSFSMSRKRRKLLSQKHDRLRWKSRRLLARSFSIATFYT
nr:hypothetical protein [Pseudomonas thivervalensis]